MIRQLPLSTRHDSVRKYQKTYELQSQKRFYALMAAAVLLHLLLMGLFKFQPEKPSLKKMTASMFQAIRPSQDTQVILKFATPSHTKPVIQNLHMQETANHARLPSAKQLTSPATTAFPSAPLPIRKRIVSAASHQTRDALYLAKWQAYVEAYGNTHYPEIALKNNLQGELRLLVGIRRDGSIHEISLRKSSGSAILDQAAIALVKAAGPFEPLPPEMSQDIEVLEIIRTWQFRGRLHTTG